MSAWLYSSLPLMPDTHINTFNITKKTRLVWGQLLQQEKKHILHWIMLERREEQKGAILGAKTFSCPLVDSRTAAIIFFCFEFSWLDNSFSCFSFTALWTVVDLSWQVFLTGGLTTAALFWTEAVIWGFSGFLMINICLMRDELNVSLSSKHTRDYSSDYL